MPTPTMLPPLLINSWSEETLSNLAARISNIVPKPLILIDGAAGSGKTTLAANLVHILNANFVHSDDVSWCADPIHWDDEMLSGIINPWINGKKVAYKPTGWIKENRSGSIDVDPDKALIIEGMGAGRKTLRAIATYSIWVDTNPNIARSRVVQRDLENGENGGTIESVTNFADWWDSLLMPLFLEEKPWKYVDAIVSGSQSDLLFNNLMIHFPEFKYDNSYMYNINFEFDSLEELIKSMKPVKEVISKETVNKKIEDENELQKLFDNRIGPSIGDRPALDYHVFSPSTAEDTRKYPVVIWLHGMGQGCCFREPIRGTDISNFASSEYQSKFGDGAYIMIPRANEDLGMVDTLSGFLYSNTWLADHNGDGVPDQLPSLLGVIRQFFVEEKENIDFTRIYLAGFSAGGHMTWQTLLAMPNTFAAVIPICQAHFVPSPAQLRTVANVALWLICGEKDDLYKPNFVPTIENLKNIHTGDLRTSIFETVYNPDYSDAVTQHFSWVPVTYDFFYNDGKPYDKNYPNGIIDWLMSHQHI